MTADPRAELVDRIARAIYDAPNGLDGDQIADMLYTDERMPDTRDEALVATFDVCRQAARAAIAAMPRAEALAVAVAALEKVESKFVGPGPIARDALTRIAAIEAAAPPSGWVLVPREAPDATILVGANAAQIPTNDARICWRAMVAAALGEKL
jgi:hypothetical protein